MSIAPGQGQHTKAFIKGIVVVVMMPTQKLHLFTAVTLIGAVI